MRQIGWWGDGYASAATAMVGAPGAAAPVPTIGAQGLGIVVLAATTLTAVAMLDAGRRLRHLKVLAGGAAVTALLCVAFASFEWTDARDLHSTSSCCKRTWPRETACSRPRPPSPC